ncbi:MAG: hypothetical protein V4538_00825 [Bacteroidota bacterium]
MNYEVINISEEIIELSKNKFDLKIITDADGEIKTLGINKNV